MKSGRYFPEDVVRMKGHVFRLPRENSVNPTQSIEFNKIWLFLKRKLAHPALRGRSGLDLYKHAPATMAKRQEAADSIRQVHSCRIL